MIMSDICELKMEDDGFGGDPIFKKIKKLHLRAIRASSNTSNMSIKL